MQNKFDRDTLEPICVVIENEDEARAIVFALGRLGEAVELEAITTTDANREKVPQLLENIEGLNARIDAGEREIPCGLELTLAGVALKNLANDYEAALADSRVYTEMTAGMDDPVKFILYAAVARRILSPEGEASILFE